MHAIEFEAIIRDGVVRIPDKYTQLKNAHARVVVLYDATMEETLEAKESVEIDFSQVKVPSLAYREGVEYQRSVRDEW